ncbi:MAG: deoxyhypusine synthase family protein [Candidatus Bathyarchaeota archaeon]|nr:MAG: deoxyhypusine synthase family protein [Candidatus Bathyarchaeota archaeon]
MTLKPRMTVGQLVESMKASGVLGAGRLAKAVDILTEMFSDPDYTNFLSLAGPMVPGGLRNVIGLLIDRGYVDAIVASGANIVHDVIESIGFKGIMGCGEDDDVILRKKGMGRAGDIFFEQAGFSAFEDSIYQIFDELVERKSESLAFYELMAKIGETLEDPNSLLKKAVIHNVPIFSPGIMDSMLGFHIWTYSQLKSLHFNPVLNLDRLAEIVNRSQKVGALILGGGTSKHYVLGANILREGVDAAIQITLDRQEGGSLSGAPLEEAISWRKAQTKSKLVTVIGDATIVFPVIVAATLEKLDNKE